MTMTISGDVNIQRFRSNLYEKLGSAQIETVHQRTRSMAHLVQHIRKQLERLSVTPKECIAPSMFDDVVRGVQSLVKTK